MPPITTQPVKPPSAYTFDPLQPRPATGAVTPGVTAPVSAKHPDEIIIDQRPASERKSLNGAGTASFSKNSNGKFNQTDLYFNASNQRFVPTQASFDFAGTKKETTDIGRIYFEVNRTDIKTAGTNAAKTKVDDAQKYINELAANIIATLSQPGSEDMQIEISGHASFTGHDRTVKVKDANGNITEKALNQHLSEERGRNVQQPLLDIIGKTNPELLPRIKLTVEAKADRELTVDTKKENNDNRNVSIRVVSSSINEADRSYRVLHLDKRNIDALQHNKEPFTYDLAVKSDVARDMQKNFPDRTALAARGSIVIDPQAISKPVDINVIVDRSDDFRLLLKNEPQQVSYKVDEKGIVNVIADGKHVANVSYRTADGQQLQRQDVLVGKVSAQGKVQYATRDVEGEQKDIAARQASEAEQQARRDKIIKEIAGDDNIITREELKAYTYKMNRTRGLTAREEWSSKNVEFVADRKKTDADRDRYLAEVRSIGGLDANGKLVVTKEQMDEAKARLATFDDLLKDFKMPQSGSLAVEEVRTPNTAPTQTANLATTQGPSPSNGRG